MSSFLAAMCLLGLALASAINFTTVYEWDEFDFVWPSGADSSKGQIKPNFKQEEIVLQYMAVFGERLFLSTQKTYGINATIFWLPTNDTSTAPPKLAPFPSWEFHKKVNCNTIDWVSGMQADTDGRLWVLDQGRGYCPSHLRIFDLLNNDTTERIHQFPDKIVSHFDYHRWMHDIVLDKTTDDTLAYIIDAAGSSFLNIVVYSRKMDKSWKVKTPGLKWTYLALSANTEARQLYLTRFGCKELYSLSVSELKNKDGNATAEFIGKFTGHPYRMLIDSANVLYAVFYSKNYVSKWNISEPFLEERFYEVGELGAFQPFTFALDSTDTIWMTERNQSRDNTKPRHKLLKAAVGADSY
ncbi:protein yellow-like [Cloeon dipterum]|uniref:protein yellow-like n=1 Tax=Cloeon dipterum TaxID=197152 RepID=UPI0032207887